MTSLFRAFLAGAALAAVISAGLRVPRGNDVVQGRPEARTGRAADDGVRGTLPRPTTPKAASFPGRATYRG